MVVVSDDRPYALQDPTRPGHGAVTIVVKERWIPSKSALSPYGAAASECVTAYIVEPEQRRMSCSVPALVYEPAVIAFLLTNELGVPSVTWEHSRYPAKRTIYALRLV